MKCEAFQTEIALVHVRTGSACSRGTKRRKTSVKKKAPCRILGSGFRPEQRYRPWQYGFASGGQTGGSVIGLIPVCRKPLPLSIVLPPTFRPPRNRPVHCGAWENGWSACMWGRSCRIWPSPQKSPLSRPPFRGYAETKIPAGGLRFHTRRANRGPVIGLLPVCRTALPLSIVLPRLIREYAPIERTDNASGSGVTRWNIPRYVCRRGRREAVKKENPLRVSSPTGRAGEGYASGDFAFRT